MNQPTELTLIRHGEPTLAGSLLGKTDSPLADMGWQQMQATVFALPTPDVLLSSPLKRCAEFAQYWAESQPGCTACLNDGFQEIDFGDWDGQTFEQIAQHSPDQLTAYYRNPAAVVPPAGEALLDFSQRVERALLDMLAEHSGKRIYLICHAGVIRTLVAWCLDIPYQSCTHVFRISIDYASVTRMLISRQQNQWVPQLTLMNWLPELS